MCRHPLSLADFGPGLFPLGGCRVSGCLGRRAAQGRWACMESYPVQCRIVEIVYSGLAITGVVLIVSVAPIFLASMADRPKIRAASIVAGFVGLAIVMAFGAELSWALSIELRY